MTTPKMISGAITSLPISHVIDDIKAHLQIRDEVVIQAPPGAGKTTAIPLALLSEPWLKGQKILMLEPRRIAARGAAERMAGSLGEPVGQTVGYKVRLDSKVSQATCIEVITEGLLTRYLQSDPSLEGIGCIIFDEFHERSLDADLGLALALQSRSLFRSRSDGAEPLKIVIMSATLEQVNIASLLASGQEPAPVVLSEGKQYPVDLVYSRPTQRDEWVVPRVVDCVRNALTADSGSLLVFLPGQREIRQVEEKLLQSDMGQGVNITPLYGDLSLPEQVRAIEPAPEGERKVVLATTIAESSLTIKGITVVVDAGLYRCPVFDPGTGMTRLNTTRISKASSIQRMGRAGRVEAGRCYRLWSSSEQEQLADYSPAEIRQADLAPVALQLLCWGVESIDDLDWLDAPPLAPYQQALELLEKLGAAEKTGTNTWRITQHGEAMAGLPVHPRLAHMLILGVQYSIAELACDLAVLVSERDIWQADGVDITHRLALLQGDLKSSQAQQKNIGRLRKQSKQYLTLLNLAGQNEHRRVDTDSDIPLKPQQSIGFLLACAYPDRIAKRRKIDGYDYLMSNGRAAQLRKPDPLQQHEWLVIANAGGIKGQRSDQVFMASEFDLALFDGALQSLTSEYKSVEWSEQREKFIAEHQLRVGAVVVSQKPIEKLSDEDRQAVLIGVVQSKGLNLLPWNEELLQWRARVQLLRQFDLENKGETEWPDFSDEALLNRLADWLGPYLNNITHIQHFSKLDLASILMSLLPWPLPKQLDELAPQKMSVPSGSNIKIDYTQSPPVLAVRLQEILGCTETPAIANGNIKLMLHLLSPAMRPLQVTQDLASFWENAYSEVKKDMKGRYPKHYWPDNPLQAEATSRAKPRK